MVFTNAVRGGGWSRRAVLGAVGSAGLVSLLPGCAWWDSDASEDPAPDPAEPLLATTRSLIARYEATLADHPDLAERLRPLRETHLAHEAALLAAIQRPELATPAPDTGVWSPPRTNGRSPEELVDELREAERTASEQATWVALAAPPERAALLGSLAAAQACHVEVLT